MYIVFIIACSASGQAHFWSPALHQLDTDLILQHSVVLQCIYIAIYYTKSSQKDYMKILQIYIKIILKTNFKIIVS